MNQIDLFKKHPFEVQEKLLQELIEKGATTYWGKQHRFKSITSYNDFRKNVPLQEYSDVEPFVKRLMEGENYLLWPTVTKWFAKSSGTTTHRSKFIPVTNESLQGCHYKGGKDLLAMYYTNHPKRKLYNGKHLIIGGSAELNPLDNNAYFGDLSAIIVKNLPWWAEIRRTPSREIALMSEWEEKIERMAESTIKEDVLILAGVPSWTMVLATKILEITGKNNLKEVWPKLELFMHGGVNFDPYREQFKRLIPDPAMNYVETYNASEGFFGMQDQVHSNELLLMLDYGIYYEFIPMSEFHGTASTTVMNLEEVELGINYAMVVTTNGGLWRYILGDTIQFTSTHPFRFRITGRTKSYLNTFGEEVIVENAESAIAWACKETNAQLHEYTAAPIFMTDTANGSHEWLVEFTVEPTNLEAFNIQLDNKLREINSDYDAKRFKDLVLSPPTIRSLPTGTFSTWLKSIGKLGGQNKVPRLTNDRTIVEQLLNL